MERLSLSIHQAKHLNHLGWAACRKSRIRLSANQAAQPQTRGPEIPSPSFAVGQTMSALTGLAWQEYVPYLRRRSADSYWFPKRASPVMRALLGKNTSPRLRTAALRRQVAQTVLLVPRPFLAAHPKSGGPQQRGFALPYFMARHLS